MANQRYQSHRPDPRPIQSHADMIGLTLCWLALLGLIVWAYATGR
jgi:hypothetical protein